MCNFSAANLLCHDERKILEIGFIHLDHTLKNWLEIRQTKPELTKPVIDRFFTHMAQFLRLLHGNFLCPTPKQSPPRAER